MDNFPGNSKTAKQAPPAPQQKKIERVTSGEAVQRKKGLGSKFKETFIGGHAKDAGHYVFLSVIIPSAKDLLAEAAQTGIERLIYGDSKPRRGAPPGGYGSVGRVDYRGMSAPATQAKPQSRALPRTSRTRHDFGDIIIQSRPEAEEVLDQLYAILDKFESVPVADLYEMTGIRSDHTDYKWGWTDLRGAEVKPLRGGAGFLLALPKPIPFD